MSEFRYSKDALLWIKENASRLDTDINDTLDSLACIYTYEANELLAEVVRFLTEQVDVLDTPNVLSAGLLPAEMISKIPADIFLKDGAWWVDGTIKVEGDQWDRSYYAPIYDPSKLSIRYESIKRSYGVKIALKLKTNPTQIYFIYNGSVFRMIDNDTALSIVPLWKDSFNNTSKVTDYEHSDIKNSIDRWLEAARNE